MSSFVILTIWNHQGKALVSSVTSTIVPLLMKLDKDSCYWATLPLFSGWISNNMICSWVFCVEKTLKLIDVRLDPHVLQILIKQTS